MVKQERSSKYNGSVFSCFKFYSPAASHCAVGNNHRRLTWPTIVPCQLHFIPSFFLQFWLPDTPPVVRKSPGKPFSWDQTSSCSQDGGRKTGNLTKTGTHLAAQKLK